MVLYCTLNYLPSVAQRLTCSTIKIWEKCGDEIFIQYWFSKMMALKYLGKKENLNPKLLLKDTFIIYLMHLQFYYTELGMIDTMPPMHLMASVCLDVVKLQKWFWYLIFVVKPVYIYLSPGLLCLLESFPPDLWAPVCAYKLWSLLGSFSF